MNQIFPNIGTFMRHSCQTLSKPLDVSKTIALVQKNGAQLNGA